MCGIFGISYGPEGAEGEAWTPTEFLQIMFPAIVHRGPHAFGWMWYDGEKVGYEKHAGSVTDPGNLALVGFPADVDESKIQWVVGHVRWATHGTVDNPSNNHPILHNKILGVHNGVLRNYDAILDVTGREDPTSQVDSEAIFAAVDHYGHRAGLRKVQGDMVAVYANLEKPQTLHIARSHGRSLETTKTPNKSYIFASETKVIDATGITHSAYSPVSRNRLLRIRGGKVLERITYITTSNESASLSSYQTGFSNRWQGTGDIPAPLKRKPVIHPRKFLDRSNPSWMSQSLRETQADKADRAKRLRRAVSDPASRNLQDHDQFGEFYYLNGTLMTEAAYMQAVADLEEPEGDPELYENELPTEGTA